MNISKLVHTFPIPAILLDNDFSIVQVNDLVCQLVGIQSTSLETKPIVFLFPDINFDSLQSNLKVTTEYCTPLGKKIPLLIQLQHFDEDNVHAV